MTWHSASVAPARHGKRRPGDTVLLTPFDLFLENAEMELYYEVGGIRPGASYRHEIAVFRIKGERGVAERRPVVTLAFDEPATEAIVRAHRTLQLARLKPGRYLIEVRVVSPAGGPSPGEENFRSGRCHDRSRAQVKRKEFTLYAVHSHSIVAGGFELTSYTTRFTPWTSFATRLEIRASASGGNGYQSAVIPSRLVTARSAITWS